MIDEQEKGSKKNNEAKKQGILGQRRTFSTMQKDQGYEEPDRDKIAEEDLK